MVPEGQSLPWNQHIPLGSHSNPAAICYLHGHYVHPRGLAWESLDSNNGSFRNYSVSETRTRSKELPILGPSSDAVAKVTCGKNGFLYYKKQWQPKGCEKLWYDCQRLEVEGLSSRPSLPLVQQVSLHESTSIRGRTCQKTARY